MGIRANARADIRAAAQALRSLIPQKLLREGLLFVGSVLLGVGMFATSVGVQYGCGLDRYLKCGNRSKCHESLDHPEHFKTKVLTPVACGMVEEARGLADASECVVAEIHIPTGDFCIKKGSHRISCTGMGW